MHQLRTGYFVVSALFASLFAYLLSPFLGVSFLWVALPISLAVTALLSSTIWYLTGSASGFIGRFLWPSGGDPFEREYSEQESLVVRGAYSEAADSFRSHLVAFPDDNNAKLRLAKLLSEQLGDTNGAIALFLAVRGANPSRGQARLIGDSLINIYRARSDSASLTLELARLADEFAGTSVGEAAANELARLNSNRNAGTND